MTSPLLTPSQVEEFREQGYLIVNRFYDPVREIEPIQLDIWKIINILLNKYDISTDREPFSPTTFDRGYQHLITVDRRYGSEVYDAIKQIPAFTRLTSLEKNEGIFRQLRDSSLPAIAGAGSGIRIDNPRESKYRSLWHYEYRDQLRSIDGIVFWSPLVPITEDLGAVQICPKSHLGGLRRSYLKDPDHPDKTGAYALRIENETAELAKYEIIAPLTEPGDLVLMDFLTLHSSGINISNRSRWSMQFRYFNFHHPSGIRINWSGCITNGIHLESIHPELVIEN
jgi:hypothetical protein